MKIINSKKAPKPVGPYSHATISENKKIVFLSGQIALENGELKNKNIEVETKQVLKNLEFVLEEAEVKKKDILKTEIFLTNLKDFAIVNEIYEEFMEEYKPARITIGVNELPLGAKVEIAFTVEV